MQAVARWSCHRSKGHGGRRVNCTGMDMRESTGHDISQIRSLACARRERRATAGSDAKKRDAAANGALPGASRHGRSARGRGGATSGSSALGEKPERRPSALGPDHACVCIANGTALLEKAIERDRERERERERERKKEISR